jgi:hypothetical protein
LDIAMSDGLTAYATVDFSWTRQLKSVWVDPKYHLPDLHQQTAVNIVDYLYAQTPNEDPENEPLGQVIVGPAGFGKTHLVGELRRQVWERGGWFVLLDFIGIKEDFWSSVALGFLNSLQIRNRAGLTQGHELILKLSRLLGIEERFVPTAERWKKQSHELMLELVRFFTRSFAKRYPTEALQYQDVITALVLLISEDFECQSIAHDWLQGTRLEGEDVHSLGLGQTNSPLKVVQGLSWVMSRIAPTMIAVDQVDAIVTASNSREAAAPNDVDAEERRSRSIVDSLAQGLLDLHEVKHRAVTVVACLEATWTVLQDKTLISMQDRYRSPQILPALNSGDVARGLIAARLAPAYAARAFTPPIATWPFADAAFESAVGFSPRQLLKACDRHQQACLAAKNVTVCQTLNEGGTISLAPETPQVANLSAIYRRSLGNADITGVWGAEEGERFAELLDGALRLLQQHYELPNEIDAAVQRDPDQKRPALHGRLSFTFLKENSREQQYCFRMLEHTNARAFQGRLRAAITASGLDMALPFRHLFVLRREALPGGAKTEELIGQFRNAGGEFIAPADDDLRAIVALTDMQRQKLGGFETWLRSDKPLFETGLFQQAGLCPPEFLTSNPEKATGEPTAAVEHVKPGTLGAVAAPPAAPVLSVPASREPAKLEATSPTLPTKETERLLPVGHRYDRGVTGAVVEFAAELLLRHVAILAGSGSGKTVLLRRIVEEAALLGIPSIVLDPNNDLSRLGDPWPESPASWSQTDQTKAERYGAKADVVVWTPGVSRGNPISLKLLPDFAATEDGDERSQAVDMALSTLLPFVQGNGPKARRKGGVLADALRQFAATGGGDLSVLIDLLAELPDDVSQDSNALKLAGEIADELRAEVAMNPLLKSSGEPLDPKTLFQGPDGKSRVSVINLAGLADDARDSFVNRLQTSLFTFIKRNPAPTGRLYVLDEAQNFAPSNKQTACKASAMSLAAQARKYGLGMIFATQAPKGIDNKIISNCLTQFYGRMSSPATIDATRELMAAKGGAADDIGKLPRGEFYFSTEGSPRPFKIRTPMSLSFHPANPPTGEEVVQRAVANRP